MWFLNYIRLFCGTFLLVFGVQTFLWFIFADFGMCVHPKANAIRATYFALWLVALVFLIKGIEL